MMETTDSQMETKSASGDMSDKVLEDANLLTTEKLPADLPEDVGATPSQTEARRPAQVNAACLKHFGFVSVTLCVHSCGNSLT